jgi:3-oxoacyl-[acyl-carrier protein] reductase
MDLLLSNKVTIITGASRGIGKAIAETLSAEGMKVVLAARSRAELELLAKSLPNDSLVQAIDLREPDSANQVVAATIEKFGKLDLLVNNAGATKRGDFLRLTDEEWTDGFALKFYGAITRHARHGLICKPARGRSSTSSASVGGQAVPSSPSAARSMQH